MTYKVMITVHDTDISEVLDSLGGKRGKYLLLALTEFLKTKKGRKTLMAMTQEMPVNQRKKEGAASKPISKSKAKVEVKAKPKIDIDSFL